MAIQRAQPVNAGRPAPRPVTSSDAIAIVSWNVHVGGGDLSAVIDRATIVMALGPLRADLGRFSPGGRFARRLAAADALIYEEIARRRSSTPSPSSRAIAAGSSETR